MIQLLKIDRQEITTDGDPCNAPVLKLDQEAFDPETDMPLMNQLAKVLPEMIEKTGGVLLQLESQPKSAPKILTLEELGQKYPITERPALAVGE